MQVGDWVQATETIEDEGEAVARSGDIGHVLQEESEWFWALVFFERSGRTVGVTPSEVKVLCKAAVGKDPVPASSRGLS